MREDLSKYLAHASHPDLGDEVVEGRLVFDRWRIRFESETITLEILLTRLQIEGEPENGITFSDPEQPGWVIQCFDSSVLTNTWLLQQSHTRHQIKELRSQGEWKPRLKITFAFLAAFALIALLVSSLTGYLVRALVARVPPKWEQDMGDKTLAELKKELTFIQDPKLLAKLDRGVKPLVDSLPDKKLQYTFYLVSEPSPNAFALPGGHVLVTTGLLEFADRPEEIAGVVAHEIAHVTQKHVFRQAISSLGPYLLIKLFIREENGLLGVLGEGSQLLISQSFSQEYELEADAVGFQYLVNAHIDPRGSIDMLTKLKAEQAGMKGMESTFRAFDSHPATEKRIQRLEQKWKKLKDKSAFIALDKDQP